ncbi:MAG: hypothetical protein VCD33_16550 [Alphaproteobacteria bacterium]|jgi:hypothetical protein
MTFNSKTLAKAFAAAVVAGAMLAPVAASAGTVENLERERAILIETLLNADATPAQRAAELANSRHRLVDLERMVLRDDSLVGVSTPTVKRAFANYDLTFLVHAAAENEMSVIDNWLEQMGITTQSLMSAKRARR